jgi:hypothetical protein
MDQNTGGSGILTLLCKSSNQGLSVGLPVYFQIYVCFHCPLGTVSSQEDRT